jgi:hypothetical protein
LSDQEPPEKSGGFLFGENQLRATSVQATPALSNERVLAKLAINAFSAFGLSPFMRSKVSAQDMFMTYQRCDGQQRTHLLRPSVVSRIQYTNNAHLSLISLAGSEGCGFDS